MGWLQRYRSIQMSAEQAVSSVRSGDFVWMAGNAATPRVLARALAAHAASTPDITVGHVLLLGEDPLGAAVLGKTIRHRSFFVGPADRAACAEGGADYVPAHLSDIPRALRARKPRVALLTTAPPDAHGFLSLGVEVLASLAAAELAEYVVVQVNPKMPRVFGNAFLHVDDVHAIVEAEDDLPELKPSEPSEVERSIAGFIAPLVPERATMQLGIGGIPDAVMALLSDRRHLGIHTEMLSDGVMKAFESGVITGRFKTRHRRKVVTTFALGTRALYDWLHENAAVEAHPCDHTNDLVVASSHDRLVAINSAISVDLGGQVNSDSIGTRVFSGVGGQLDFIRAAARSNGGVPIIALPATAKNGAVSRIVPALAQGAGVVTPRADVHWVVTEYGAVNLFGLGLRERGERLASIAAPQFRDELLAAARAC